jgi:formylglycine-generating enzyme required for sulfatase activity
MAGQAMEWLSRGISGTRFEDVPGLAKPGHTGSSRETLRVAVAALTLGIAACVCVPQGELVSSSERTPPATISPTAAYAAASAGVTRNADWTPYTEAINRVEMALVPAGCFLMGNDDASYNESPAHRVCFEEPFWIDVYEVTNARFAGFGGAAGRTSHWTEPDRPREMITWAESAAFCELRGARLPTEAEWEYAARGPDGLEYPWGNEFRGDNVVRHRNADDRTWDVGSKSGGISWIGAHDLSGNVSEWVNDWYGDYLPGQQVNPQGPETGQTRVRRGGSWSFSPNYLFRGAYRMTDSPDLRNDEVGFRCALSYQR